jgi:hypothetical protein
VQAGHRIVLTQINRTVGVNDLDSEKGRFDDFSALNLARLIAARRAEASWQALNVTFRYM